MTSRVGSPSTGWRVAFVFAAVSIALTMVVLYMAFGSGIGQQGQSLPTPGPPVATTGGDSSSPVPTPRASASGSPRAIEQCPTATVTVSSSEQLQSAMADAQAGDVIRMKAGTYTGNFVAATSGDDRRPIYLCGGRDAVISGDKPTKGYALHLDEASYWRLLGFAVTNAQKGVMLDGSSNVIIQGLEVSGIGDEAIHLRAFSSDNVVDNNEVHTTGLRNKKYGEGIYIGTAESNWCTYSDCQPDNSDRNVVSNNTVHSTSAENVDIKEGTSGGQLIGNTFDGAGMTGGDSWVDVKGNDWLIRDNVGTNAPTDGYQTHVILDGWGDGNRFEGNESTVDADGYAINATKRLSNVVACDNTQTGAEKGLSNVTCT